MSDLPNAGDATDRDDVTGQVVACLLALARDDHDGALLVMRNASWEQVGGFALGLLTRLGPAATGSDERWVEMLSSWRPGEQIGGDLPW